MLSRFKDTSAVLAGKAHALLFEQRERIGIMFAEKIKAPVAQLWKDDAETLRCFGIVYDALPFPIRLAVKQEAFLGWAMANRQALFERVEKAQQTDAPAMTASVDAGGEDRGGLEGTGRIEGA